MRPILELAGVRDVLAKSHGSGNPINTAWATMAALRQLKRADQVGAMRGKTVQEMVPWLADVIASQTVTPVEIVTVQAEAEPAAAVIEESEVSAETGTEVPAEE